MGGESETRMMASVLKQDTLLCVWRVRFGWVALLNVLGCLLMY